LQRARFFKNKHNFKNHANRLCIDEIDYFYLVSHMATWEGFSSIWLYFAIFCAFPCVVCCNRSQSYFISITE